MSLILDALKKAEQDRHVGQAPMLDEMLVRPSTVMARRQSQQRQELVLLAAIAAAVLFALAGLLYWFWPSTPAALPEATPAAVAAPVAADEPAAPVLRVDPERLETPVALAPEDSVDLSNTGAAQALTMDELDGETPQRATTRPAPVEPAEAAVAIDEPAPPPAEPSARPLKEMPPAFRSEFPKLTLEIHVYDDNPLRRFVLINGKKYRETDTLADGPRIVEITPDGVIVEQRGSQVLLELPR